MRGGRTYVQPFLALGVLIVLRTILLFRYLPSMRVNQPLCLRR